MDLSSDDFNIDKMLESIKSLFNNQKSYNAPLSKALPETPASNANVEYQAPIKGSWNSSGGFDPVSIRPNGRKGHMGLDLRAPAGTPIYPLAPGIVTSVGTDPIGGNVVNIQHANGVRSYYAHLSTAKVLKGDKVDNNTIIGGVGDTGNAAGTWPHCHFQVWKNNQLQDPAQYFSVPKYTPLKTEEKQKGKWVSEEAKQQASAFNMQQHVSKRRIAFSRDVSSLVKVAEQFYKLSVSKAK